MSVVRRLTLMQQHGGSRSRAATRRASVREYILQMTSTDDVTSIKSIPSSGAPSEQSFVLPTYFLGTWDVFSIAIFWLLDKNKITTKETYAFFKKPSCLHHCWNISTTPIMTMGCWQCLPLSVVQLKGKGCRKPHCPNEVLDTFRPSLLLKFLPQLSTSLLGLRACQYDISIMIRTNIIMTWWKIVCNCMVRHVWYR